MSSVAAETTTRVTESHYPRTPTGHSIKGSGRLRTITELLLPSDTFQKPDRTRIIYWQAITANNSACRKIKRCGQIQSTLLGTGRRGSKQRKRFLPDLRHCQSISERSGSLPCSWNRF